MSNILELASLKDLDVLLESRKTRTGDVVIIEFYASWCGPCRAIAPKYEALAKEYEGKAIFARADVDEALDLSKTFAIRSMPTFVVLRDGEQVEVQKGPSPTELQALIKKWAEKSDRPGPATRTPKELEAGHTDARVQMNQERDQRRILGSGIASVVAAGLLWGVWLWFQEGLPAFGATNTYASRQ